MRRYQQTYIPITEEQQQQQQTYDWGGKPFLPYNTFIRANKDQSYFDSLGISTTSDERFNWFLLLCQDGTQLGNPASYTAYIDSLMGHHIELSNNSQLYYSNMGQSVIKPFRWSYNETYSQKTFPSIRQKEYIQNQGPSAINGDTIGIIPMDPYSLGDPDVKECNIQLFYFMSIFNTRDNNAGSPYSWMLNTINTRLEELYGNEQVINQNITNRNLHGWYGTGGSANSTGGRIPYLDGRIESAQFTRQNGGLLYYAPPFLPGGSGAVHPYWDWYTQSNNVQGGIRVEKYNTIPYNPYTELIHGDVVYAWFYEMPWNSRNSTLGNMSSEPLFNYYCYLNMIGVLIPKDCPGLPKIDI